MIIIVMTPIDQLCGEIGLKCNRGHAIVSSASAYHHHHHHHHHNRHHNHHHHHHNHRTHHSQNLPAQCSAEYNSTLYSPTAKNSDLRRVSSKQVWNKDIGRKRLLCHCLCFALRIVFFALLTVGSTEVNCSVVQSAESVMISNAGFMGNSKLSQKLVRSCFQNSQIFLVGFLETEHVP